MRGALVVLQLASSLVLALGAGLLIRSLMEMTRIDLGFEPDRVLTAQLQAPPTDYRSPTTWFGSTGEIDGPASAAARRPGGWRRARAAPVAPIGDWSIRIEGRPYVPAENPNADFQAVTPGYFEAMRLRLVRGRVLAAAGPRRDAAGGGHQPDDGRALLAG